MGLIYAIYGMVHLYLFQKVKTDMSYSNVIHEAQYIVNYSFFVLNIFIYVFTFGKRDTDKLKKSVLIALGIYIISIYLSIITGTSSPTYIEGMGYKGWFESGNSLSSIFTLGLFIILPRVSKKKKYIILILLGAIGIFLCTLIGTRVGLFGFVLALGVYATAEIITAVINKRKLNKFLLAGIIIGIAIVIATVAIIGSTTLARRKHLKDIEGDIVDKGAEAHISGSLLKIKDRIDNNDIKENELSKPAQQSILDLYNYANEHNVINNDMRRQQTLYNIFLVKNQANPILLLFGNGYMANYRELVLEVEMLSLITNFGLIGFILYVGPLLVIFAYAVIFGIKNWKNIDVEYLMLLGGIFLSFALSTLSGYTFFNSSSMMFVVVLATLIINKINETRGHTS